jgi:hypothetical protein
MLQHLAFFYKAIAATDSMVWMQWRLMQKCLETSKVRQACQSFSKCFLRHKGYS